MKTLGEAAMELPWLAPNVDSILTLARMPFRSAWPALKFDPGILTLFARTLGENPDSTEIDVPLLDAILRREADFARGFINWSVSSNQGVYRLCYRQAVLAEQLAVNAGVDERLAWTSAFLAPLGWLGMSATLSGLAGDGINSSDRDNESPRWRRERWGTDHDTIARRLARSWRFPVWLSTLVGNLALHVDVAERLGADKRLFAVVQLAVSSLEELGEGFNLTIGTSIGELCSLLRLAPDEVRTSANAALIAEIPTIRWRSLAETPLAGDVIRLALEQRRRDDAQWIERLQLDIDRLQGVLSHLYGDEQKRLLEMKISAMAEFAAGAGHEINNPLAVISGQAQYVLKQMDWFDVPAEEIENIGEYMTSLRQKIVPSLQKVIGQTQRIHNILTDLMLFARPASARMRVVPVDDLVHQAMSSLLPLAQQRNVHLSAPELRLNESVSADETQARIALSAILRNAIEAAPTGGWARVRVDVNHAGEIELIVEDNGPGLSASAREHMFDPFFSGRSAGRGRGMGLPIAWRLARQQGGDVRIDSDGVDVTRFVLTLPRAAAREGAVNGNGYHTDAVAPPESTPFASALK